MLCHGGEGGRVSEGLVILLAECCPMGGGISSCFCWGTNMGVRTLFSPPGLLGLWVKRRAARKPFSPLLCLIFCGFLLRGGEVSPQRQASSQSSAGLQQTRRHRELLLVLPLEHSLCSRLVHGSTLLSRSSYNALKACLAQATAC